VEFALVDDGSLVCAFYNFGNDPSGPKILRRGNCFKAWTQANGELPRKASLAWNDRASGKPSQR
jgi:hypothetical protein